MRRLFLLGGLFVAGSGSVVAISMQGCASVSCQDDENCPPTTSGDGSTDGPVSDHQLADVRKDGKGNGDAGEGGGMDGMADGETGPTCDLSQPPSKDNCVLQDGNGFFVAPPPYGNDTTGNGSIEAPYATITKAVSEVTASSTHRIYVCDGTYSDQITVSTGVSIFGGLSCSASDAGTHATDAGADGGSVNWAYASGTRAIVQGTSADYVLKVDTVSDPVDLEYLELDAATATTAGQSSIAALVNASPKVSMVGLKLVGGMGGTGTTGGMGASGVTPTGANGKTATDDNGAGQEVCTCGSDTTIGGAGGTDDEVSATQGGTGSPGQANGSTTPYPPSPAPSNTGAGGPGAVMTTGCMSGFTGALPPPQSGGTPGAAGVSAYTLNSSGFSPAGTGGTGSTGSIGQGGGGGGGGDVPLGDLLGGGGGGGCGGCGGIGGFGGGGGGSSIGLAVVGSTVTLANCVIQGGTGGPGGPAGPGGGGGAGGLPGTPSSGGCSGGTGGQGGTGGPGAGGGGGASIGIATDAASTVTPTGTTMAIAGTPGSGGLDGNGATTYQGATGLMEGQQAF
jgi:hypothetical protein